jgi:hypothetical protein
MVVTDGQAVLVGSEGTQLGVTLSAGRDSAGTPWLVAASPSYRRAVLGTALPANGELLEIVAVMPGDYPLFGYALAVGGFGGVDAPIVVSEPTTSFVGLYGGAGMLVQDDYSVLVPWTSETQFGQLGVALASGDLDQDGVDELLVSAPSGVAGVDDVGDVIVLTGAISTSWSTERQHLRAEFPPTQNMGQGFCDVVDYTADGVPDIGVSSEEEGGRIWIVPGETVGDAWLPDVATASLEGESPEGDAGKRWCAGGDGNGDGHADLLLGAPILGVSYLIYGPFDGSRSLVDADARVDPRSETDACGHAVTFLYRGDADHIAVGCTTVNRVEIFSGLVAGSLGVDDAVAVIAGATSNDGTGAALTGRDDLTGDLIADLAVGVPGDSSVHSLGGAVYVFDGLSF